MLVTSFTLWKESNLLITAMEVNRSGLPYLWQGMGKSDSESLNLRHVTYPNKQVSVSAGLLLGGKLPPQASKPPPVDFVNSYDVLLWASTRKQCNAYQ